MPMLCRLHDYIEIACLFRYPVALLLDTDEELKGVAIDTLTKPDKTEYLVFVENDSKNKMEIPLSSIRQMQSCIDNPHFDKVDFPA